MTHKLPTTEHLRTGYLLVAPLVKYHFDYPLISKLTDPHLKFLKRLKYTEESPPTSRQAATIWKHLEEYEFLLQLKEAIALQQPHFDNGMWEIIDFYPLGSDYIGGQEWLRPTHSMHTLRGIEVGGMKWGVVLEVIDPHKKVFKAYNRLIEGDWTNLDGAMYNLSPLGLQEIILQDQDGQVISTQKTSFLKHPVLSIDTTGKKPVITIERKNKGD